MLVRWDRGETQEAKYYDRSGGHFRHDSIVSALRVSGVFLSHYFDLVRVKTYFDSPDQKLLLSGLQMGIDEEKAGRELQIKYTVEELPLHNKVRFVNVICDDVEVAMDNALFWLLPPLRKISAVLWPDTFKPSHSNKFRKTVIVADRKYFFALPSDRRKSRLENETTLVMDHVCAYEDSQLIREYSEVEVETDIGAAVDTDVQQRIHDCLLGCGHSLTRASKFERAHGCE
jgi:hypothetical protein